MCCVLRILYNKSHLHTLTEMFSCIYFVFSDATPISLNTALVSFLTMAVLTGPYLYIYCLKHNILEIQA